MKIQEMAKSLRPREKAQERGIESLSDEELLALFIRTGVRGVSALEIAENILNCCTTFQKFASLSYHDFRSIKGIGDAKAIELTAICEVARRILRPHYDVQSRVSSHDELIEWLTFEIGYEMQEHFLVVFLSNQNVILGYKVLFKGTIDRSVVHPRDIIREALFKHACRIILVHNHPGGSLRASEADIYVTQKIVEAAKMMGIEVSDHLIIANSRYYSLKVHHSYLFSE